MNIVIEYLSDLGFLLLRQVLNKRNVYSCTQIIF